MKFIFLITFLAISGISQSQSVNHKIKNISIKVDFFPSFHRPITFKITIANGIGILVSTVFNFDSLSNTVAVDSVNLSENDVQSFFKSVNKVSLLGIQSPKSLLGNDGITIKTTVVEDGKENSFSFWSPRRKFDPEYYIILDAIFALANKKLASQEKYYENIENYLDYGLGIKQKGKHPTIIRMYGSYSINDDDALYKFFKRLPRKSPIIFDMSNFGSMGTFAYDYFSDYDELNQKVIWVAPGLYRRYFINVGIDSNKIVNDVETAMKIIFENNSR